MPTEWTVERVEEMRLLYARGDSASVIAAALGGGATRNSVIGKIHRLRLPARGRRTADPVEVERKRQAAQIRHVNNQRIRRAAERGDKAPVLLAVVPPPPPFEGSLNLAIGDLRERRPDTVNQCRYPEGDAAPFFYCGNETAPGSSWCGHHHPIVHASHDRQTFKVTGTRRGMKASNFSGSFEPA